ncbi:hypothetical protein [Streptomyces calidiresistens]|uniref:Uncharacterized protein n=1 Tax=Streptomyces calidiresistens TaxID=1485586 RepID=A0A7W3XXX4_9ACTN|nr:hypothetical protein [Streptomyces calidiresistens]MBB0231277.1 hypothetical protein [Streptomyces calidiresistens]
MSADLLPILLSLALTPILAVVYLVPHRGRPPLIYTVWDRTKDILLFRTREPAAPARPRPDYTRIAVLEWEIYEVEPKPGTAAAAAVNFHRFAERLKEVPDGHR